MAKSTKEIMESNQSEQGNKSSHRPTTHVTSSHASTQQSTSTGSTRHNSILQTIHPRSSTNLMTLTTPTASGTTVKRSVVGFNTSRDDWSRGRENRRSSSRERSSSSQRPPSNIQARLAHILAQGQESSSSKIKSASLTSRFKEEMDALLSSGMPRFSRQVSTSTPTVEPISPATSSTGSWFRQSSSSRPPQEHFDSDIVPPSTVIPPAMPPFIFAQLQKEEEVDSKVSLIHQLAKSILYYGSKDYFPISPEPNESFFPNVTPPESDEPTTPINAQNRTHLLSPRVIESTSTTLDAHSVWNSLSDLIDRGQPFAIRQAGLTLLRSCIKVSTFRPSIVEDNDSSTIAAIAAKRLAFYHGIRSYAGSGNESSITIKVGKSKSISLEEWELSALVDCLATLARDGKEVDDLEGVCELLVHWIKVATDEKEDVGTMSDLQLKTPLTVDCNMRRPLPPRLSTLQLLTKIHRFSLSKLHPYSVETTFECFLTICRRTTSEDELSAFLEHVKTVVEFGEVPSRVLSDVVAIVAKIIGLEGRVMVVNNFDDSGQIPRSEQQVKALEMYNQLGRTACVVMEKLLVSPGNQALKCLRQFTSAPSSEEKEKNNCDVLLLVGSLRSLSHAIERYDEDYATNPQDSTSTVKITPKWPPILHVTLRSFLYQHLHAVMNWKHQDVAAEVLSLINKIQQHWNLESKNGYEEDDHRYGSRRESMTETTRGSFDSVRESNAITFEEWDVTFEVLTAAIPYLKVYEEVTHSSLLFEIGGSGDRRPLIGDTVKSPSVASFVEVGPVVCHKANSLHQLVKSYELIFHRLNMVLRTQSFIGPIDNFFELLSRLAPYLTELTLLPFLDQCQSDMIFYPSEEEWLDRLKEAVAAFYVDPSTVSHSDLFKKQKSSSSRKMCTAVRRKMLQILRQLHEDVADLEMYREVLTHRIIVPLLEQTLPTETEALVAKDALILLEDLAQEWFKLEILGTPDNKDLFERVKSLLLEVGKNSGVSQKSGLPSSIMSNQKRSAFSILGRTKERINLKATSTLTSPLRLEDQSNGDEADVPVLAISALVSLFHVALEQSSRPSLIRCVHIFRDLIDLLSPPQSTDPDSLPHLKDVPEPNPVPVRVRLVILQWLMRLRAGPDHKIYFVQDVEVSGLAEQLRRTMSQSAVEVALSNSLERDKEDNESRGRFRSTGNSPERQSSKTSRERSSSRTPQNERSPSRVRLQSVLEQPQLWLIPDMLPFIVPQPSNRPGKCGLVSLDTELMSDYDENQTDAEREESGIASDVITDQSLAPPSSGVAVSKYVILPTSDHFQALIRMLRYETSWELISYILCYLPQQLSNKHFSAGPRASQQLNILRKTLCDGLQRETLQANVVLPRNVKRAEVYSVAYQSLVTLLAYPGIFSQASKQETVQTFVQGLSKYKETAKPCIHALAISCYDLDKAMMKSLPDILKALSKIISMSELAVHILELIAGIAQVPALHVNFTDEDFRTIFAISLQYIAHHKLDEAEGRQTKTTTTHAFQQYVLLLAYYLIFVWYLAIRLPERKKYVSFITERLVNATFDAGYSTLDDASETCFDMLARYSYANAEPRPSISTFDQFFFTDPSTNEEVTDLPSKSWVIGHSIITVVNLPRAAWSQVIIRRPSGKVSFLFEAQNISGILDEPDQDTIGRFLRERGSTTKATVWAESQQRNAFKRRQRSNTVGVHISGSPPSAAMSRSSTATHLELDEEFLRELIESSKSSKTGEGWGYGLEPPYFVLQMSGFPDLVNQHVPVLVTPGQEDAVARLDMIQVVDAHKVGVVYVGPGQTREAEILRNSSGSKKFIHFLSGLGSLLKLKGAHGLDVGGLDTKDDLNGTWTFVWQDQLTQIIFHVPTLMPTLPPEQDPMCIHKKMHIGNDYVNIIFNESGQEYKFNTISSQFTHVNIVIEPHTPIGSAWTMPGMTSNTEFYKVTMLRREQMPETGPLGDFKMVSTKSLASLVRRLALQASLFSQTYAECQHPGGQFVSSWRHRLQRIRDIKERSITESKKGPVLASEDDGTEAGLIRTRDFTLWCS